MRWSLLVCSCSLKVVVNNEDKAFSRAGRHHSATGRPAPPHLRGWLNISPYPGRIQPTSENQKGYLADSLATLYAEAGRLIVLESLLKRPQRSLILRRAGFKAGDQLLSGYTFALNANKQGNLGEKTRELFQKVLDINPKTWQPKRLK